MTDKRDLLAVLKTELSFLESGGYASDANPWRPAFIFEDSPSCLNFGESSKPHACSECALVQLVPESRRKESRPCRFIHFPAHWDPKLRIPRGQVVAAASIVSPKY